MNKISVIIPTYNDSRHIKSAINSVLNQSFKDFEIIVIDDGSTDDTGQILNEYIEFGKIKYFFQRNMGQSVARFDGLNRSKGEMVAFLDSDDKWVDENKLKKQIDIFNRDSSVILVGTGGYVVSEKGFKICEYPVLEGNLDIKNKILMKNQFIQSSVLIKRSALELIGKSKIVEHSKAEDYYMWLKLGTIGNFANINEPMVEYMVRDDNTSLKNKKSILKNNISIIKEFKKKYPNYPSAFIFANLKFFVFLIINFIPFYGFRNKIIKYFFKLYRSI